MNTITTIFSNEWLSALGWALLHSLWQGALIALLLGVVLLFLQKQAAKLRYALSAMSLGLMLFAFFGTFAYLHMQALAQSEWLQKNVAVVAANSAEMNALTAANNGSIWAIFLAYFTAHLPGIVVFWLLGVLVLSLRFLGNLAYLERLKHTCNRPLPQDWQARFRKVAEQIGVQQKMALLESSLVKVPMVVGYFKPIVLLPIGTINALEVAEVEAILAHELAHIYRHDYLVNLLQSIIEVLFFYHPAIWWVSKIVRTERENSCDDVALSVTGSPLIIAKALANLEALRLSSPPLSLAFTGSKNQLLKRISRLLGKPMKTNNNFMEGMIAVVVIALCLTTINSRVQAAQKAEKSVAEVTIDSVIPAPEAPTIAQILEEGGEIVKEYVIIEKEVPIAPLAPAAPADLPKITMDIEKIKGTNSFSYVIKEGERITVDMVAPEAPIFDKTMVWATAPAAPKSPKLFFGNSFPTSVDTSILGNKEIVIIDGDNVTIIRRKGSANGEKELEVLLERFPGMEWEMTSERLRGQVARELEIAQRHLEMEQRRLERLSEGAILKNEREIRALERKSAELARALGMKSADWQTRAEKQAEEIAKRAEEIAARAEEIAIEAEQRAMEHEKRAKADEKERTKKHKALEKQLQKDGFLKADETIKTININEDNGVVKMKINGKKVPADKAKAYLKILE